MSLTAESVRPGLPHQGAACPSVLVSLPFTLTLQTAFRESCPALVVLRGLEGGGLVFSLYLSRAGSKRDNLGAGLGEGSKS